MADIKTKKKSNLPIKQFDRTRVYTQKMRKDFINAKDVVKDSEDKEENNPTEYGINKIENNMQVLGNKTINKYNHYGIKSLQETKDNIQIEKNKIKKRVYDRSIKKKKDSIKIAEKNNVIKLHKNDNLIRKNLSNNFDNDFTNNEVIDNNLKINNNKIKNNQAKNNLINNKVLKSKIIINSNHFKENTLIKSNFTNSNLSTNNLSNYDLIENVPKISQNIVDISNKINRNENIAIRKFQKSNYISNLLSKKRKIEFKSKIKNTVSSIKAIIKSMQALIYGLMALGWLSIFIIIIVCLIALICSSSMGIFFSNERFGNHRTMSSVLSEINTEFTKKITDIQINNPYDEYEINSNRADWKDVLSIYAVLVTDGKEQSNVMILDDKNIEKLKNVFWDMNKIDYRLKNVEREVQVINDDESVTVKKEIKKVLYIDITSKTVQEMIDKYNFNKKQKLQLAEISKSEYNEMWSNILYGSLVGSTDIVQVAMSQIGNVGGEPYWSWYGFDSRVEWCATFVSWCANQCGYIDAGIIPKFASCQNEGIAWFKTCGLWQESGYIPKERRYYIF